MAHQSEISRDPEWWRREWRRQIRDNDLGSVTDTTCKLAVAAQRNWTLHHGYGSIALTFIPLKDAVRETEMRKGVRNQLTRFGYFRKFSDGTS